jgi:hypothetical protein
LTQKDQQFKLKAKFMDEAPEIVELLREIRDTQREHLEEYRTAAQRSIELQQRAVNRAENISKIYRIALSVSAVLVTAIIVLVLYLMTFLRR